jgi:hypothetical protein
MVLAARLLLDLRQRQGAGAGFDILAVGAQVEAEP